MRFALTATVGIAFLSTEAFAQNNGVWSGYVRGWVNDSPQPVVRLPAGRVVGRPTPGYPVVNNAAPNVYWAAQQLVAAQLWSQQNYVEEQARIAQREREATERAQAAEAALVAREQALADQKVQLAQQQRLAAERELAAQQEKLAAAQEAAATQLAAAAAQQQAAAAQLAAATAAAQKPPDDVVAAKPAPTAPQEKGPDIHRWVDDEGVVHLSTKPPPRVK